ncbi:related to oxidoreductase [Phialocephala subalpina]|uniref:Related to oxidoreductase n=1 Tax=Phialocephala subalpina TaxID=576137 RepID=A0A1L7XPZ5_9HELO|nr:related to oxidoreductase [Phialocephala subalpina]
MSINTTSISIPTTDYLPVDNPTASFWQEKPHQFHDLRTTLELPPSSDVVIIGAGYAGIATAYHLAKAEKNLRITVLEARGVCSGATGRNGGHLRPDMYGHIPTYMERAGVEAGLEIAQFEVAHLDAIKKVIEKEKIDCDFTLTRTVDVWINEAAAKRATETYNLMASRNLEYMDDVFFSRSEDAENISGIKGAKACATYTAGTISPYKFILGLTEILNSDPLVNIQTYTPVTKVSPDPKGGFIISTHRGTTHAKQVVYANNAYVAGLLPEYNKAIVPCKGTCSHITVPVGKRAPQLTNSYIIREEDSTLSYLIPRIDGSIVVGGANSKYKPFLDQWYNNVDDSNLIEMGKDHFDTYMQRFFHGWEDSGARVDKIWSGVMGYSFDSNPHIGALPKKDGSEKWWWQRIVPEKDNQFVLAGFNGHGMPVIWLAAKGISKMITEGVDFEETKMPRLFKTTRERIENSLKGPEGGDILV